MGYGLSRTTRSTTTRAPTSGLYADFGQDFAGVGGDVNFVRSAVEVRSYYESRSPMWSALFDLQAGNRSSLGRQAICACSTTSSWGPIAGARFCPVSGLGPRDLTPGTTNKSLGGTLYWGASVEAQTPLYFLPKDIGIKVAAFADAGNLWSYKGPTSWNVTGKTLQVGLDSASFIRSSVGAS